jgi:hypothetical protein
MCHVITHAPHNISSYVSWTVSRVYLAHDVTGIYIKLYSGIYLFDVQYFITILSIDGRRHLAYMLHNNIDIGT